MNDSISSRSLLLEQLESRCLLAAGMFLFSEASDDRINLGRNQDHGQTLLRDHPFAEISRDTVRSADLMRGNDSHAANFNGFRPLRSDQSPPNTTRFGHSHPDHIGDFRGRPAERSSDRIASPVVPELNFPEIRSVQFNGLPLVQNELNSGSKLNSSSTSSITATILVIRVIDSIEGSLASKSVPRAANKSTESVASPPRSTLARTLPQANVDQVLTSSVAKPIGSAEFRQAMAAIVIETSELASDEADSTDRMERTALESKVGSFIVPATSALAPRASTSAGGLMDSPATWQIGPFRSGPHVDTDSDHDTPWELDRGTLHGIRDLTEQKGDESNAGTNEQIDGAIASWFGNRGGLIDIEAHPKHMFVEDASSEIVDIVLDATFGLHRSLDLIASVESMPSGDFVRDAVLNAIAGERNRFVAPIAGSAPMQSTILAHPAATIVAGSSVAGTLALANRRRHSNALWATKNNSKDDPQ